MITQLRWVVGIIVLLATSFTTSFVATQIADNRDFIEAMCEQDNIQDAKQVQLWEAVIALTADAPTLLTPEQQAEQTRQFRVILNDMFAPQDCAP